MFDQLTAIKEQFIASLRSLPDSVTIPLDERTLKTVELKDIVSQDITNISGYWDFITDNRNRRIIALIGMVNAGKSAVGNLLAQKRESEVFQEGPVRETAQAAMHHLTPDTLLIDLPGLGSVLADEDDAIVKSFVRRANLLLVVISIDSPITKHLYEFFQSDILKKGKEQQVILVLNKTDMWDGIPETHQKRELERYVKFLTKGDSEKGFLGISSLFDYEVPIIPFSVKRVRNGKESSAELTLREAISRALSESTDGWGYRAKEELFRYIESYSSLVDTFVDVTDTLKKAGESRDWVLQETKRVIEEETEILCNDIVSLDKACWDEMQCLSPPGPFQKFFGTAEFKRKAAKLREVRESYGSRMCLRFETYGQNVRNSIEKLIYSAFAKTEKLSPSDSSEVHKTLQDLVYLNWDVHDDCYYRDKEVSNETISRRTKEKRENCWRKLDIWLNRLEWQQAVQKAVLSKYRHYMDAYSALEKFVETLLEVYKHLSSIQD